VADARPVVSKVVDGKNQENMQQNNNGKKMWQVIEDTTVLQSY